MISVLVWKLGCKYPAYWYNRLRRAVERNLHAKHEFVVIADDPSGLDQEIRVVMGLARAVSTRHVQAAAHAGVLPTMVAQHEHAAPPGDQRPRGLICSPADSRPDP